jgi:hypothetical protein
MSKYTQHAYKQHINFIRNSLSPVQYRFFQKDNQETHLTQHIGITNSSIKNLEHFKLLASNVFKHAENPPQELRRKPQNQK